MVNCFLLLACLLFSFACNLIRKIYDNQCYSSTISMIKNVFLSGIAGFFFSLILNEFLLSPFLTVLLSGIGGFFGIQGLEFLIRCKFDNSLHDELAKLINTNTDNIIEANIISPNQIQKVSLTRNTPKKKRNKHNLDLLEQIIENEENIHHVNLRVVHNNKDIV